MSKDVLKRMRNRAQQLRRIAMMAHDPSMTTMLQEMAGQIEADAARLEGAVQTRH